MPNIQLSIKYKVNSNLVINPQELIDLYFYGIPIVDSNGRTINMVSIYQTIYDAQGLIEKMFNIKMMLQEYEESKDWFLNDWQSWGYMRTTFPVVQPISLDGFIGTVRQITYPPEWLSYKKASDGENYMRQLHIVPNYSAPTVTNSVVYSGIIPHLGFMGNKTIPNYWNVKYVTGFKKVPRDLIQMVGLLSSIQLFIVLGDIVLSPGVSSQSISIDGLSQSIGISSGSAYKNRIEMYLKDVENRYRLLKNYYKGFTFTTM
jgi:hypothetical protein